MRLQLPTIYLNGQIADFRETDPSQEKEAELERFIAHESDQLFCDIAKYLGRRALRHAGDGAVREDIARNIRSKRRGNLSIDNIPKVMTALRKHLLEHNQSKAERSRPYHLVLPFASDGIYKLLFEPQSTAANPTVALWQRLVRKTREISLIYDTPNPHLAGSGDVAAVGLITQVLARIQPPLDISPVRYCDIGERALDPFAGGCHVILGASSEDIFTRNIENHPSMRGRQVFQFKAEPSVPQQNELKIWSLTRRRTSDYPDEKSLPPVGVDGPNSRTEYAVIGYFICPDRTYITLRGTTSVSTLGAAILMRDRCVSAILNSFFTPFGISLDKVPSFELLLKVTVGENASLKKVDVLEMLPHTVRP